MGYVDAVCRDDRASALLVERPLVDARFSSHRGLSSGRLHSDQAVGISGISGICEWLGVSAETRFVTGVAVCQAVLAIQWLWILRRLWVAVTNRHFDRAAALPLRMK